MTKIIYLCILDFEATCWNDERNDSIREIIEFPSVLIKINHKNKVEYVSEFRKYVKPIISPILSDFCTELTGITQENVSNADIFEIVYKEHYNWLVSNIGNNFKSFSFVTCGNWDLKTMLPIEINRHNLELFHCYKKIINIKNEFEHLYGKKAGGMKNMLDKLKINLEGKHHCGIDDCKNITKIVIKMIDDGW